VFSGGSCSPGVSLQPLGGYTVLLHSANLHPPPAPLAPGAPARPLSGPLKEPACATMRPKCSMRSAISAWHAPGAEPPKVSAQQKRRCKLLDVVNCYVVNCWTSFHSYGA
jgi:hypothetical protein